MANTLLLQILISFQQKFSTSKALRLAQANLVTKTDFDDKLRSLNQKNNSNKTKHLLVQNELKKSF